MPPNSNNLAADMWWAGRRLVTALCLTMTLGSGVAAAGTVLDLGAVGDAQLKAALETTFEGGMPAATAQLAGTERQATVETQRERLTALLIALGYLDARVDVSERSAIADAGQGHAPEAVLTPVPGEVFRIGSISIEGIESSDLARIREDIRDLVATFTGKPVQRATLSRLEEEILWRLRGASYPYARIRQRDILPVEQLKTSSVRMSVAMGEKVRLGKVVFHGLTRTDPDTLLGLAPFAAGDPYRPDVVQTFDTALHDLGQFRSVNVERAAEPNADGEMDLDVYLQERFVEPMQLSDYRLLGVLFFGASLAALGLRQIAVATGAISGMRQMRLLDVTIVALLVGSAFLAFERVVTFANLG